MIDEKDTKDFGVDWGRKRRGGDLAPNLALWEALRNGEGLTEILTIFYKKVYQDPKLSHFFDAVTLDRAIGKQFSFLMEVFTGRKVYFGERPRNAHHIMVISDELFDYRERLIEQCMREWGLAEEHIKSWLTVHEVFRKQIVKSAPVPKKVRGVSLPLDGHEWLTLSIGSMCDGCAAEIQIGSRAAYHVRTGQTYCTACAPGHLKPSEMEEEARHEAN